MILEDAVEKAAYARPGFSLAAFKEAALPVYQLTARALTLERKAISPIEEACLRAVDAGLTRPEDICNFLGLPRQVLKAIFASLNSSEHINYVRPLGSAEAQVLLTAKGRLALTQAKIIEPAERLVKIAYDPLLKKVVFLPTAALFRPKEVKERGWLEVPLCGAKRPEVEDVPLADIDKVVQRLPRGQDEIRELLSIRRIERRELHFTPCIALFYRSHDHKEVQVAFFRDDGISLPHETAFAQAGGPDSIGAAHVLKPCDLPIPEGVDRSAIAGEAAPENVEALNRVIAEASLSVSSEDAAPQSAVDQAAQRHAARALERLKAMTQRAVLCHEHPKLLRDALTKTRERLLIISPWIRHQVVDNNFVASLEALLRNGVKIYIGYGLAEGGKATDKDAISPVARQELDKLMKRFDNLTVKFVGNTHRKQLVSDSVFSVVTSFNWLSFRGDPREKARDELGFLVSDPEQVEALFQSAVKLIDEGYEHPPKNSGSTKASRAR